MIAVKHSVPREIASVFEECGTKVDLRDYIMNSVLSFIESKEQELILGMRYNEWVRVDTDSLTEFVIEYLDELATACRERSLSYEEKRVIREALKRYRVIGESLCHLAFRGVYGHSMTKYLIIKDSEISSYEKCVEALENNKRLIVRSRFIEHARNLFKLKQRFGERRDTVVTAKSLVDRVFAYAEPKRLPVGTVRGDDLYNEIRDLAKKILDFYYRMEHSVSAPSDLWATVDAVLKEFFGGFEFSFYKYQVRGIKQILEQVITSLKTRERKYSVIEAPTGSGKTEIFVLSLLVVALIRKLALTQTSSPVGIIIYPRRSLASNQVDRLLSYTYKLNKILEKMGLRNKIILSMNYTEVRPRREYQEALAKASRLKEPGCKQEYLRYGVVVDICREKDGRTYLRLGYFSCPSETGSGKPILTKEGDRFVLYCGGEKLDFVRVIKEQVSTKPGDIHITLFETLRNALWESRNNLFGNSLVDRPVIMTLDEIHTYVDMHGARYAYLLQRIMRRIEYKVTGKLNEKLGFTVIGLSATLPGDKEDNEFLKNLFLTSSRNISVIAPTREETIPLGNEYFFILVSTLRHQVTTLSVTIQGVMEIFFNTPPLPNEWRKRAIVFIDNLDLVKRAVLDIRDAFNNKRLQDLRNPMRDLFEKTLADYGDEGVARYWERSPHVLNSWYDGELWWGYGLETKYGGGKEKLNIDEYTSVRKPRDPAETDIIIATSTLEVGIDYSDVVLIFQHGAPPNLSALIQRAGRAGRRLSKLPTMRTAVAIILSPELPRQSSYFEIFTRSKSLRNALEYDRLFIGTRNKFIMTQTAAEAVIDYMVCKGERIPQDSEEFECGTYISFVERYRGEIMDYLMGILPRGEEIASFLDEIIGYLRERCSR